jgi:hypothetical protein
LRIRFLSPANKELDEAIDYYNHQLPGLGFRFFQEVSASVNRILLMPEAWTKIGKTTRRCLLKGFPYSIYFVVEENEIIITALANSHRNPEYYTGRIT